MLKTLILNMNLNNTLKKMKSEDIVHFLPSGVSYMTRNYRNPFWFGLIHYSAFSAAKAM